MTFSPNHPCANELASMMTLQREVHHLRKQIDKMKNCYNCKNHTHSDGAYYYETYKICNPCLNEDTLINWKMKDE